MVVFGRLNTIFGGQLAHRVVTASVAGPPLVTWVTPVRTSARVSRQPIRPTIARSGYRKLSLAVAAIKASRTSRPPVMTCKCPGSTSRSSV
jgi:hypothetical protein